MSDAIKEEFYLIDVNSHRGQVYDLMRECASAITKRGKEHDASKFTQVEKKSYSGPVWDFAHGNIKYGSPEYADNLAKMGEGLTHHYENNDHHPEHFAQDDVTGKADPYEFMTLFSLMEMLCDWTVAAKRKGNSPKDALVNIQKKYPVYSQLVHILENTLDEISG